MEIGCEESPPPRPEISGSGELSAHKLSLNAIDPGPFIRDHLFPGALSHDCFPWHRVAWTAAITLGSVGASSEGGGGGARPPPNGLRRSPRVQRPQRPAAPRKVSRVPALSRRTAAEQYGAVTGEIPLVRQVPSGRRQTRQRQCESRTPSRDCSCFRQRLLNRSRAPVSSSAWYSPLSLGLRLQTRFTLTMAERWMRQKVL